MSDQPLLIHNALVCTLGEANQVIADGAVLVAGGRVAAVGRSAELLAQHPNAGRVDAHGKLLLPGSLCAHTHFYGAFARGLYIPGPAPRDFPEILRRLWWTLDRALDEEGVRYSALVCLVDAVRHGTTTLVDHHASPSAIDGSLDIIAEAVEQAGLRACLCYEVTDRNGLEGAAAGIAENVRFIKKQRNGSGLLSGLFGLHASLSLSDETLARCVAEAEALGDVGFHIHAAEGPADQEDSLAKYGLRTVDRLHTRGILGPRTIVAHVTAIDAWEMAVLRETQTWVTHQPRSNMNNAVGVADVPAMLRGGMPVLLGNDGFSNDMFTEMKTAYLLHKVWRSDPRVATGDQVIRMAYRHNAALAQQLFGQRLGELAPGAAADLILLDYYPITPLTADNLPWHIIFGVSGSHVTDTMVAGRWLMRDRRLLTLDEEAIAARSREVAQRTWRRFWDLS
ncbi:MAG: putative aminohydrolase SsnA [Caldilineales bacterium]|nr:putative aminohydrolase SsnA [Caldilineales bacterium]